MGCAGSRTLTETKVDAPSRPISAQKPVQIGSNKVLSTTSVASNGSRVLQEVPCEDREDEQVPMVSGSGNPIRIFRKFSRKSFDEKGNGEGDIAQSEFWRSTVRVLPPQSLTSMTTNFNSATNFELVREDSADNEFDLSDLTWDLDPFEKDEEWLNEAAVAMFKSERSFTVSDAALHSFLATVKLNYHNNPFHNWVHAFSVLQASWMMVQCREISQNLTGLDRIAIMIAAICHDIDHPGVNNDFLAKAQHPIALHYPAPHLENHHAAMTLKILCDEHERFDILGALGRDDRAYVLDTVVQGIAATDMGQHKAILEAAQARVERPPDGGPPTVRMYDINSREDRLELVALVLHAADLSAQAFCTATAYKFGRRVIEEFHAQYGQELSLGVAPSVFMKDLQLPQQQAKTQLGFMNFILKPLWAGLAALCPELRERLDRVEVRIKEIDNSHPDTWPGAVSHLHPFSDEQLEALRHESAATTLRARDQKRSSVGQLCLDSLSSPLVSEEALAAARNGSRRSLNGSPDVSAHGDPPVEL